jgi:hypothetical protein
VKDFITLAAPLNKVVKKSIGFKWGEEQKLVFVLLKEKLCSACTCFGFTRLYKSI